MILDLPDLDVPYDQSKDPGPIKLEGNAGNQYIKRLFLEFVCPDGSVFPVWQSYC